jgi:poly(3-hydroxybutyrate) depolymerase
MALIYAARFPGKVARLALAGAPIDLAAGKSKLSELAHDTPIPIFRELVDIGGGRILGQHALQFWAPNFPDSETVRELLQSPHAVGSSAFRRLESRFRDWYAWTLDLPGTYYLQVVEVHRLTPPLGHYVSIRGHEGASHTFKVVSVEPAV